VKLLAIVLLLCNGLLLAWLQFGQPLPEPDPAEFHPERIRLVQDVPKPAKPVTSSAGTQISATSTNTSTNISTNTSLAVTPATGAVPSKTVIANNAPSTDNAANANNTTNTNNAPNNNTNNNAAKTTANNASPPTVKTASTQCLAFDVPNPEQVTGIQTQLNQLQLGARLLSISPHDAKGPFWIYYPPLPNRQAVDDKISQLHTRGIQDVSPVRNGPWQNALSLGLYAKASTAQDRLKKLHDAGIAAQIEAYGKSSRSFELLQLTPDEQAAADPITHQAGISHLHSIHCPSSAQND
jgi:hypothetical protein